MYARKQRGHPAQARYAKPTCQYLSGGPIDEALLDEFFRVLQPAQIDALERVSARQAEHHQELLRHLEQEVTRLERAARRAERQYNAVDPENRLIAATLEKRWEVAPAELEQAKGRLAEAQVQAPQTAPIPAELREAFADVGRRLPEVWSRLSAEGKKSLLRTLVEGVNQAREDNGMVRVRVVWRGGPVSERGVRLPVSTRRRSEIEARIVARIEQLATEGLRDIAIAESLNQEGYFPCRGATFTPGIVLKLRCQHGIHVGLGRLRRGELPRGYTITAMARLLGIDPGWIYRRLHEGRICIARDPVLRREVALEVARPETFLDADLHGRFRREAVAAAGLVHPNLVPVYELGEVGPWVYIVSAYCPGPSLAAWLREQREPVAITTAARLVAALADAVAYMHGRGVLHRDIKPDNVLLQVAPSESCDLQSAVPRLTEFGLAKVTDGTRYQTQSGVVLGTPAYMSPEQAAGRVSDLGPATDVYALGVLLYELLTGRPPLRAEANVELLRQVLHDEPLPPGRLPRGLPRDLESVCLKCLEKKPERRYASAAALADDLRRFVNGQATLARPLTVWQRGWKGLLRRPRLAL
jgi:hypothetical protein